MKLLRQIGIQFGVTFVALALLFTLGGPLFERAPQIQKSIIYLGMAGEAYAVTPDYELDGVADDVQLQAALNALPSTGGRLVVYGGTWDLNATVSRAINNVTIQGAGKGTYFTNNAATAIFSAGAQTGWVFKDFRTDAGWLTLATDTRLDGLLWRGTELVSNVVASGTTMPASPVEGQQFIQDTTGRTVLYTYKEAAWYPEKTYGAMTVYVDKTDGTDAIDKGTGVDAAAYETIQYAIDQIPPVLSGDVTVNINAESYAESVYIGGKSVNAQFELGGYQIYLVGTMTTLDSLTAAAGSTQGAGAVQGTIIRNAGAWLLNERQNKVVRMTSGACNGEYAIIDSNIAGANATIVGGWTAAAPAAGDTFVVEDWGTTVNRIDIGQNQGGIVLRNLNVAGDGTFFGVALEGAWFTTDKCSFNGNASLHLSKSFAYIRYTFFTGSGTVGSGLLDINKGAWAGTQTGASKFLLTANGNAVNNTQAGIFYSQQGDIFDGGGGNGLGVGATTHGLVTFANSGTYARIRNFTGGTGCFATTGGQIGGTANNQYSGNFANETAVGASFGYID